MPKRRIADKPTEASYVFTAGELPMRRVVPAMARRLQQICLAITAEELAGHNLTQLQFAVLNYINHEPDMDQNRLAARMGIDRTHTSLLVEQLEAMGLIDRRVNGADRRARLLRLTRAGLETFLRLRPKMAHANERILAPLGPGERELLLDLLVQVIEGNRVHARPGAARRKRGTGPSRVKQT